MMNQQQRQYGFTLVELMTVLVSTTVLLLGLTTVLANSQSAFNDAQNQMFGDVSTDSYVAQRVFDHFVRKSTKKHCQLDENDLAVFYYSDPNVALPDRYAWFVFSDGDLLLTTGDLSDPGEYDSWVEGTPRRIAQNVLDCEFVQFGAALRMYLTLDDGQYGVSITTSAIRQN